MAGELVRDDQLAAALQRQLQHSAPQPHPVTLPAAESRFGLMVRARKFGQMDKPRHEVRGCKGIWELLFAVSCTVHYVSHEGLLAFKLGALGYGQMITGEGVSVF